MSNTNTLDGIAVNQFFDWEHGLVDRSIFSDPAVYQLELDRVFRRAWLFMCHESQIVNAGDFFQTYMGEDQVVVTRAKDGGISVLLNSCRHRGASVCKAHSGNTSSFMCAYHGWTYDLEGKLIGVPGVKDLYGGTFDRSQWGLRTAAKVQSYRGFVFATLDDGAPDLETFLGRAGLHMLDRLANYGDIEVVPGVIRHRLPCNWKLAMENDQDYYHVGVTHSSAFDAWGWSVSDVNTGYWKKTGQAILGEYGHVQDTIEGHHHANIFPHLCLFTDLLQAIVVRHPKGPTEIEQWYFTFVSKNSTPEEKKAVIERNISRLGPAGMVEQDDGENWQLSTAGSRSQALRDVPLNYQMGLGSGSIVPSADGFPVLGDVRQTTEEYARWQLRAWAEWLEARSWSELIEKHSVPASLYPQSKTDE